MAEILAGLTVPTILQGAWSVLKTAYSLYGSVKSRREQLAVLLDRCRILVEQMAKHAQSQPVMSEEMSNGVKRIETACASVKDIIETLTQKGFLWCLVNSDKIDLQVHSSQSSIQDAFNLFEVSAQFNTVQFQSDLKRALINDRDRLSQHLHKLSQNDEHILQAIQDQNGVHRKMQELLVGIFKHVQNLPMETVSSPENMFLRDAAEMLCRKTEMRMDKKYAPYTVSSLEIDFNVSEPIGSGSSGQVFRGKWNGTSVAVKRMHVEDARVISTYQRKALRHEAKVWSALHHPNILPFYGACMETEVPFLVMQYCSFGDVRQYLRKYHEANRVKLSCELASGLTFLHSKSIVHADIKGMNVLVNQDHRAVLSDFGLSLMINDVRSQSTYSKELHDKNRGTLSWMAPEVLSGASPDMAADVYALGMTIWEIFSGENPFKQYIDVQILMYNVVKEHARPDRPKRLSEPEVWDIVQKCWMPDSRFRPHARQVAGALKLYVTEDATHDIDSELLASVESAPTEGPEDTWTELMPYLEAQSESIVYAIQSVLAAVRTPTPPPSLNENLTHIIGIVSSVVVVCENNLPPDCRLQGEGFLGELSDHAKQLTAVNAQSEITKESRQCMAKSSFAIANAMKGLMRL